MRLNLVDHDSHPHSGYGAGSGSVIFEKYECPCGKGFVKYEKDDIPGFRDSSVDCDCEECREKYEFARGSAKEKER